MYVIINIIMSKAKKKVFIAATRQNDGKTMTSLGLFNAIKKRFPKCGYMKPVGQQYLVIDDKKVDKDAVLFQKCYQLEDLKPDVKQLCS